jgi:uncharacterized protein (DUF488 family)
MPGTIWTIGHSTRSLDEFVSLMAGESVELVADVRRFPVSRRHPQFNREALASDLARFGIGYLHLKALGGRRSRRSTGSPNTGWRVEAFNAYADYMATAEFEAALGELMAAAQPRRAAIMCAEAVPWRCHRRLIADALTVRGWTVRDIIGSGKVDVHRLTDFARVSGTRLTYTAEPLFPNGQESPPAS